MLFPFIIISCSLGLSWGVPKFSAFPCLRDEVWADCVNPCNTCQKGGRCLDKPVCKPGCDCRLGYLRAPTGFCIPKEKCEGACPSNEEHSNCVIPCNDCGIRGKCKFLVCNKGCDCQLGHFRNREGRCIPVEECPPRPHCKADDEMYYECVPNCHHTCETYNKTDTNCLKICEPGCGCKMGYVKREDGKCVSPAQCHIPGEECAKDEQYYECMPDCKNTCRHFENPRVRCRCKSAGCFCKEGLVKREKDGRCVRPQQCPKRCPLNEEESECVVPCNNCKVRGNCEVIVCNKGCDCKNGHYRNKEGECIPADECPAPEDRPRCRKRGEVYRACGSACPPTCEKDQESCRQRCVSGCFCRPGLLKNKDGDCVRRSECDTSRPEPSKCPENAVFIECGSACAPTCQQRSPESCSEECVTACFCKPGFLKSRKGKCVPPQHCDTDANKPKCPENAEFLKCGSTCMPTCDNPAATEEGCPQEKCAEGCFCETGFLKSGDGRCVRPQDCESDETTGRCRNPGEQFLQCGTSCPATCENRGHSPPTSCTDNCVRGCFCRRGLFRTKEGECVALENCPPSVNPPSEKYPGEEEFQ